MLRYTLFAVFILAGFGVSAFYLIIPQPQVVVDPGAVSSESWQLPSLPDNKLRLQAFARIVASLPDTKRKTGGDNEQNTIESPAWSIRGIVTLGGERYALVERNGDVTQIAVGRELAEGVQLAGIEDDTVILRSDSRGKFVMRFFTTDTHPVPKP